MMEKKKTCGQCECAELGRLEEVVMSRVLREGV